MRLRFAAILVFVAFAMPGHAETMYDGAPKPSHQSSRSHTLRPPHVDRTNGRRDCGNGDCRGIDSPGIMGGAPGDF